VSSITRRLTQIAQAVAIFLKAKMRKKIASPPLVNLALGLLINGV